jgi:hypothetical protein
MKRLISAQVILKAKSGLMPQAESMTAENLEDFMPDESLASQTRAHFENLGFEVGELIGNSFSISAPRKIFEQHFKARIQNTKQHASLNDGNLELPISALPDEIRESVNAISFSTPPAFGPSNF